MAANIYSGGPTPKYFNPTQNPGPGRARDSCLKPNKKSPLRGLETSLLFFIFFSGQAVSIGRIRTT